MDVHYELTCGDHVVAKAKTVLVCFDHKTQATIPVLRRGELLWRRSRRIRHSPKGNDVRLPHL